MILILPPSDQIHPNFDEDTFGGIEGVIYYAKQIQLRIITGM
jgi:hypothetical protein